MTKVKRRTPKHSAQQRLKKPANRGRPVVKVLSAPQLRYAVHQAHEPDTVNDDTVITLLTEGCDQQKADEFIERYESAAVTLYRRTGLERAKAAESIVDALKTACTNQTIELPFDHPIKFSHVVSDKETARLIDVVRGRYDLDDPWVRLAQECNMTLGLISKIAKRTVVPYRVAKRFCDELTVLAQIPIIPHEAATRRNYRPAYDRDPNFLHEVQEWILLND